MKIFITGVNGFIGTHLTKAVLSRTDWEITGFDIAADNVRFFEGQKNFTFHQGDIFKEDKWLEEQVASCDAVLPLAGVAKPAYYIKKPLWTFELDFEQNLKIVRYCAKHGRRLIFPSTSEVYGMSSGGLLEEDKSPLITGPICKSRWIYSCSKQMMDRVISAYGQEEGLRFTLFRPFNWVGPLLDTFKDAEEHKARSITQMIYDVIYRGRISLVNGGEQRRSFTWVGDGIEALLAIIENKNGAADGQIFNVGNPDNNCTIKDLAEMIVDEMKKVPVFRSAAERAELEIIPSSEYYGRAYDDMQDRRPSVAKINSLLGWSPHTDMRSMIRQTVAWYAERMEQNNAAACR
jgi:nucleoside-diphosphate-sugar epimerase